MDGLYLVMPSSTLDAIIIDNQVKKMTRGLKSKMFGPKRNGVVSYETKTKWIRVLWTKSVVNSIDNSNRYHV